MNLIFFYFTAPDHLVQRGEAANSRLRNVSNMKNLVKEEDHLYSIDYREEMSREGGRWSNTKKVAVYWLIVRVVDSIR